jgi:signal transduction histidine kinase/ligand-binding sensor domain-containing protein
MIAGLLAFAALRAVAADANPAKPALPIGEFVRISEDEGLTHSDVRAITQDHVGFMWFGLRLGGLTRYDGYELKVFRHDAANPLSIGNPLIWALLVDRGGTLWIATEGGLDRFDRATDSFTHFRADESRPDRLPHSVATCLFEDSSGRLWVGTRGGLARMDDRERGTFTVFRRPQVLAGSNSTNTIRSITEDPSSGLLWLGTSDGLAAFDPRTGAFASFVHDPADPRSLSANPVNKVLRDEHGMMWALTEHGLNSFRPPFDRVAEHQVQQPHLEFQRYTPSADRLEPANFVRDGLVDRKGRFWLGTRGGVRLLDRATGTFTVFRHQPGNPSSLSDDLVHTIFEDRMGTVWVGTYAGGVDRLRSELKPFRTHRHNPTDASSLSDDRVSGLAVDAKGRLWVSTARGLSRYEGRRWTRFLHDPRDPDSLPNNDLSTVTEAPNGDLWLGSSFGGVLRYDHERFHSHPTTATQAPAPDGVHPFTGQQVNSVLPDAQGGVWIGARAYGLDYFKDGRFRHYLPQPSQPTTNAVVGVFAPNGDLWFATELSGVVRFEPAAERFTAFVPPSGRGGATRSLHCITDGGEGILWIGAADGLLRFDTRTLQFTRTYSTADGLPSEAVMTIVRDRRGHLWLGTANGLADLDPVSGRIRSYEKPDGLPTNVFSQRAGVMGPDGRIYLGTRLGVVEFAPEALQDNLTPPPVVLTGLRWIGPPPKDAKGANGSAIGETIRVPAGQLGFSLRFSALDFAAPEKNRFRYRLEGWDKAWTDAGARERSATYTDLSPGTYVFRVQGSNGDQVWNEQGATVRIVIDPHVWETLWFRLAIGVLGVGAVLAALQWRLRSTRRRTVELRRQVALRTAQLEEEVRIRQRAEAELRESHDELEHRVQARTAELAQSNASLQAEIAERRSIQGQLRQAQKMEAIGQLAGGIAHDFNNLLTVILGQSELLSEVSMTAADRDTAVRDIRAAAQRATNLTRQLLVFSRHQSMAPVAVNLNELVGGVVKLLRHMIGENIVVGTELAPQPLGVMADPGMIEQVLLNMAVNARDAMPHGGRLTIATSRQTMATPPQPAPLHARPGEYACIRVSDSGSGIPAALLNQIFEPFFTTKASGKGTGLGLAISLGIVLQHQGWIHVDSTEGQGTTFEIFLPLHAGEPVEAAKVSPPRELAVGSGTVLVAEDEEPVRSFIERALRRVGYRVIAAASGAEALARWREKKAEITVVLSDVVMPGRPDGHELSAQLRAENPALRVVLMSGYDPEETMSAGADAVPQLRKPFTAAELFAAISGKTGGH